MTDRVPHVVIACDRAVRDVYLDPADLARLERIANIDVAPTVARSLGLAMPNVEGRVLTEIFRE